jgi:rRNA-processing protein FCF1
MSVVMDANALMMPVECDVRVFEELDRVLDGVARSATEPSSGDGTEPRDPVDPELLVPEAVLAELEKLSDGAGEAGTAASVGLDLARERCRSVGHEADYADDAVLEVARRGRAASADAGAAGVEAVTHAVTNDGPLQERLLDAGVPVLSLRAGNKLAVTQP